MSKKLAIVGMLSVSLFSVSVLTACGESEVTYDQIQSMNQTLAKQQQVIAEQQQALNNREQYIQQQQQQLDTIAAQQQQQVVNAPPTEVQQVAQPVQQVATAATGAVQQVANDTTVQDMMLGGLIGYAAGNALGGGSSRGGGYHDNSSYHRNVVNHTTVIQKNYTRPSSSRSFFKSNRSSRSFGSTRSYRRR